MVNDPIKYSRDEGKKIEAELEPYINIIRTMAVDTVGFGMFSKAYVEYKERYKRYSNVVQYFSKGMLKTTENPKDKMQWILYYLGLLEGINNTTLNVLIMLLKASQYQYRIVYPKSSSRIKRARSIDDLERRFIPLSAKLSFLKENGLKEVVSLVDSNLRNDVAHFRFNIIDDEIYIGTSRAMPLIVGDLLNLQVLFGTVHECVSILNTEKGMDRHIFGLVTE